MDMLLDYPSGQPIGGNADWPCRAGGTRTLNRRFWRPVLTNFDTIEISKKNEKLISLDTWLGKKEKVNIYVKDDIYITVPKRKKKSISSYIEYKGPISAPIKKDAKLGVLNIFLNDELFAQHDVFSMEKIKKVNIFSRLVRSFNFFVWGDV